VCVCVCVYESVCVCVCVWVCECLCVCACARENFTLLSMATKFVLKHWRFQTPRSCKNFSFRRESLNPVHDNIEEIIAKPKFGTGYRGAVHAFHTPPDRLYCPTIYEAPHCTIFCSLLLLPLSPVPISPLPCSQTCNKLTRRAADWHKYQSLALSIPKWSLHIDMEMFWQIKLEPVWSCPIAV